MKPTRKAFLAGLSGMFGAPLVAKVVEKAAPKPAVDPFVLGRRLIDTARQRYGDIQLQWRIGPVAFSTIWEAAIPPASVSLMSGSGVSFCGILAEKSAHQTDHTALLIGTNIWKRGYGPRCAYFFGSIYCGSIDLKTGEIDYGENDA